ncbi:hypothetical protein PG984_013101 [Apiospora sp. TS-2023a]
MDPKTLLARPILANAGKLTATCLGGQGNCTATTAACWFELPHRHRKSAIALSRPAARCFSSTRAYSRANKPPPTDRKDKWVLGRGIVQGIGESLSPYWGMAMYRTTFKDEEAWINLVKVIMSMSARLNYSKRGGESIRHRFRFFEDPALEGASLQDVRKRFDREIAAHREAHSEAAHRVLWESRPAHWREPPAHLGKGSSHITDPATVLPGHVAPTHQHEPNELLAQSPLAAAWHNYFLVVDEACLKNLEWSRQAVVKLVRRAPSGPEEGETWKQDAEAEWMYLPVWKYHSCCAVLQNCTHWPELQSARLSVSSSPRVPSESGNDHVDVWVW